MIAADAKPKLARGVRVQADRVRGGFNLLAPEHVLRVNASSAAILMPGHLRRRKVEALGIALLKPS